MMLVSYFYFGRIMRDHLTSSVNETLRTAEANIATSLHEPEATIVSSAFTIANMVSGKGESQEAVLNYMIGLTDWLIQNEDRVSGFNGLYGVVRGEYLDGLKWTPDEDYVPAERPWYIAARGANGDVAATQPYIDA
jgi:hypothetical protein